MEGNNLNNEKNLENTQQDVQTTTVVEPFNPVIEDVQQPIELEIQEPVQATETTTVAEPFNPVIEDVQQPIELEIQEPVQAAETTTVVEPFNPVIEDVQQPIELEIQEPVQATETTTVVEPFNPVIEDVQQPIELEIQEPVHATETTTVVEPTIENMAATVSSGAPNNNISNTNKKNLMLFIILGVVLVAVIGIVAFFILNGKDENKDTGNKEETKEETKPTTKASWSGVYENGENYIYIYQLNDDELEYNAYIDNHSILGTAEIDGNTAIGEIFDTYTFVLNGDKIEFSTTDEDVSAGTYNKTEDYTSENYYEDNYGDPSYLETGLNGIFEGNGYTITIFQTESDTAKINITKDFSIFSKSVDIVDGKILHEGNFFDDIETITATIDGDTLNITASSTDEDSILNGISGSYTKTKTLTIEDILMDDM